MFERTNFRKLILSYFLRILGSVAVASIIISVCAGRITEISQSLADKKRLAIILEQKNETLDQLEKDLTIIGQNEKRIREALPPSYNILDFISDLDSLAARTAVKQTTRFGTPSPLNVGETEGVSIAKIDYGISLSGNIFTLQSYLRNFENLPYFTKIDSFSIQSGNELGWEGESSVTINATLFVQENNF